MSGGGLLRRATMSMTRDLDSVNLTFPHITVCGVAIDSPPRVCTQLMTASTWRVFWMTNFAGAAGRERAMVRRLTPFQLKVFALVRTVPMGYVTTYGEVARATNSCARAVGQCMKSNPLEPNSGCPAEQIVP